MIDENIRIFPLGDTALTVEFGNAISTTLNRLAIALSEHFESNPFPGFVESVPAYASTTIFYDLIAVSRTLSAPIPVFDHVKNIVAEALIMLEIKQERCERKIEIPVYFDGASALDLDFVAASSGLTPDEVIDIFISTEYRVFMLGFVPGFAYMGEVDERIATPRKETPRTSVLKGSVGIAGRQTGVYSLESPGGWQIIGRTAIEMFRPSDPEPSYLNPGDVVNFVRAVAN